MGGTIKVAIRLHDGSVTTDTRWTNNMPTWSNDIAMTRDDPDYLREYAEQESTHRGETTVSPYSYGLVVIDALTHTIYEANTYSQPGVTTPAHIVNRKGDPESEANWQALMDAGSLSAVNLYTPDAEPIPLPMEPGRGVVDECFAVRQLERDSTAFYMINIDLAPWKIIHFNPDQPGFEDMRRTLKADGFPMNDADDAAWDAEIKELFDEY